MNENLIIETCNIPALIIIFLLSNFPHSFYFLWFFFFSPLSPSTVLSGSSLSLWLLPFIIPLFHFPLAPSLSLLPCFISLWLLPFITPLLHFLWLLPFIIPLFHFSLAPSFHYSPVSFPFGSFALITFPSPLVYNGKSKVSIPEVRYDSFSNSWNNSKDPRSVTGHLYRK